MIILWRYSTIICRIQMVWFIM